MELEGRNIVVMGLARSGLAAARFLSGRGARVTITDKAGVGVLGDYEEKAQALGVTLELGGHRSATLNGADLIVVSPGVPHTLPALQEARCNGIPVIGEIELACRHLIKPVLAVTGTNGKTTTTELLGAMLAESGLRVFVGGNIGNPLINIVGREAELDLIVAEISSFQLDTTESFKPQVGVLLNITPDHLDRYENVAAYAESKARLFRNQDAHDFAVVNGNDSTALQACRATRARRLNFYGRPPGNGERGEGAVITPRQIAIHIADKVDGRIDLSRTRLIGPHNRENIAAAALAALVAGASLNGIQKAVDEFKALAHRLEPVATVNGVHFVNDSKATNVDAVIRALECFDRPVILIMGGRNKGYDFEPLKTYVRSRVRKLIVIGEAAPHIMSVLGHDPLAGAERAADLECAVGLAFDAALQGETVLLSPACASFDMFGSYVERGETFRRLVKELP
jgi:UDP-N-acetylmuramoylalanine--D-glutamate ligase